MDHRGVWSEAGSFEGFCGWSSHAPKRFDKFCSGLLVWWNTDPNARYLIFAGLGVAGGLVGAFFNAVNVRWSAFRMKPAFRKQVHPVLEACFDVEVSNSFQSICSLGFLVKEERKFKLGSTEARPGHLHCLDNAADFLSSGNDQSSQFRCHSCLVRSMWRWFRSAS